MQRGADAALYALVRSRAGSGLLGLLVVLGLLIRLRLVARLRRGSRLAPGQAALDPVDQGGDLLVAELLVLGRHLQVLILIAHRLDQQALVRLARDRGRAALAAREDRLARVEPQLGLLLVGT